MPKQYRKPDYIIIAVTAFLVLIGLLMIFSASFEFRYLQKQLISLVIAVSCFLLGFNLDYHLYKKMVTPLLGVTALFLLLTYVPGIGHTAGGASRWLNFGIIIFQPSELAKLAVIIFLALSLENKGAKVKDFWKGIGPILLGVGVIMALIIKQPDLGTAMVIAMVTGLMILVGGMQVWQFLIVSVIGVRMVYWIIEHNQYQKDRILAFMDPWKHYLGIGFHTVQSLLAVGSGGILGLGLGNSRQKFSYLPEPFTDYIFAIICEELGFLGAFVVVILFAIIAFRGVRIARLAPDRFGMLLAFGITSLITMEAILNMSVVLALVPPTGIPLIFVSFGGTSLMISLMSIGILANISKQIPL
ncbi:MAG: putative peptidoglycan glycosyltransferase FtsW, partial [Candidatus Margulisiibacteriota bacterium]